MSKSNAAATIASFKPGQKVVYQPTAERGSCAPTGIEAEVGPLGLYRSHNGEWLDIVWPRHKTTQCNGGYHPCDFQPVPVAPAKPVEPTAPMTKAVLDLMRRKGAITQMEAQGVLRCRALPRRIADLKVLGHTIIREMKYDPTGQRYARYHLAPAA